MASNIIDGEIVWRPGEELIAASVLEEFLDLHGLADYDALLARSNADPGWFWDALIKFSDFRFYTPYHTILDASKGAAFADWCVGGTTNIVLNCLDKRIGSPLAEREALVWESEQGEIVRWTYADVNLETCKLAEGLRSLGLGRGDVVGLYMPMIPQAMVALLAVAKIGGIVLPMFSGFGAPAVASRLNDAGAVAVITTDGTWRRGKKAMLKPVVDEAAALVPTLKHVVIHPHLGDEVAWDDDRDHWWDVLTDDYGSTDSRTEEMDAMAPFMIVYTSGTSGKPKGTVHVHAGFPVKNGACDLGLCFDLRPQDRLLFFSDMGWVVGPMLAYGALLQGACAVLAEGTPDFPDEGRLWRLVQDLKVTHLGIAPTIIRSYMRVGGAGVDDYDFSAMRVTISTGEPWTPDAWAWMFDHVCRKRVPILNYVGGTEIGGGILSGTVMHALKPCSFGACMPAMGADIVDDRGEPVGPGLVGELVLRVPSIGLTRSLWKDDARYIDGYWTRYPGLWHHGDWAAMDRDGFWYVLGRSDDTLKIAGKRTGPSEIETLLMATGKVAETAVIGVPDEVKGQAIVCVCSLLPNVPDNPAVRKELSDALVGGLGHPFKPKAILFVNDLPKTRNMKVMRRVVKAAYLGESPGDTSSLVNPEAVIAVAEAARDQT
ncbi:MAG: AMP-binding protein [Gammaproteobacteria bacterium]|nr:AMP-binding protein [Gammaproteobacteria bacterium]